MSDSSNLPLRVFLSESEMSQSKAARMWELTQPAISQMILSNRQMMVFSERDEENKSQLHTLIELKEIAVGRICE